MLRNTKEAAYTGDSHLAADHDPAGSDQTPARSRAAPAGALASLLAAHRGETHAVILQDYPDPDAIACAVTHRLIAARFEIECEILYRGSISHPQNLALVQLLDVTLRVYNQEVDLKAYDAAIFVDNQGTTSEELVTALAHAGIPTLVVVDHHEPQGLLDPVLADIRRTGSTSTIYAEYLEAGLVDMQKENQEHVIAATALQLGLYTDTGRMLLAGEADFRAAGYLSRFSDRDLLQKVMAQSRPKHTMEVIHNVLGSRDVIDGFSIAGAGYIRPEDRDAIPQAADFLLTEENVHTAVVYGVLRKDRHAEALVGSMRTTKLTLSPDRFLKEALGVDETGRPHGGGRQHAGGFEIPIGFLSNGPSREFEELKWNVFDEQVRHRLFTHIGAERSRD